MLGAFHTCSVTATSHLHLQMTTKSFTQMLEASRQVSDKPGFEQLNYLTLKFGPPSIPGC